jgi:protein involved in polysaccharide export with SLBB domain
MQPYDSLPSFASPGRRRSLLAGVAGLLCAVLSGCAAVTNPVADAVPVHRLPPEVHGRSKDDEHTIPLTLLRQKPPDAYRLASGDILGIWIEGVLGDKNQPPPLRIPEGSNLPPAFGYPIPVTEEGTINLPLIAPVNVAGLTMSEARDEVIKAYTVTKKILLPENAKILVTLMRPRVFHILVVRQDTGAVAVAGPTGGGSAALLGQTKRGTGYSIELPAYENDVLNALARTGGLPGLDARNEVVIQRGSYSDWTAADGARACMEAGPPGRAAEAANPTHWTRIPLRLRPNEPPPFQPQDVVLRDGDIVFIEARDTEVFYTGGLLPPRQFPLPRDYDLDVVEAISYVGGPLVNGGQNTNNLSGNLIQPGIGFPSPSLVTVLRKTVGGGQVPIRIDLNKALRDRRERVLIQPGDVVILQQTPLEALTQYVTQVLRFDFLGTIINQRDLLGTANLNVP